MNADVIVIGAGIVGSACAFELAQRGLDVLVLDSQRGGATAVGMGHLVAMDDNPAELALSQYSIELWRQWKPRLDPDCAYRNCGTLWLAANDEEMAGAEHKRQTLKARGIACEMLDPRALYEAEPMLRPGLSGALKVSGDGILYAPNAAHWLLKQSAGRITRRTVEVTQVDGNQLRLSSGERLRAEAVVLANGIHATELCPDLPIRPKKGHLLITDRYPGKIHHQLVELGYVTSAHASEGTSVAFNAQPRPTGQLFLGSSRQFDTTDLSVEPAVLARMLRRAIDYLPELARMNAIRSWTGLRAATPDGLPLLGEHPQQAGLWLAAGHEGLGVTTAPGSAQLLAAQLCNSTPAIDPTPYLPGRFLSTAQGLRA
ncbi:FAD-binding oxidoreductase [Pseudomonas sp. FW306-02-F02-AA]|uniref:D-amino acid oxidase n=1 Tax=Pseudomonas fluorescens TaxID=294 RepID=A0A0N9WJF8_PSEFL|nr:MULTISPECIES: FAD-dependent oxidoreductase [Pseudomonas]ALI02310.1 D-amino acid oxidase [Pseudomonas fluorescens]PMZ02650.1 FAD-binding oxidoreductase [Pseudomonas sp. FW306-02-F02-AB]PMZ08364.1 FAD-binding oxidoreductase [Pseudomonas sp. FW306-02-H06C]PMZ13716.1 FAD-binding oxidoreductase [Pseudomonas sp. FW306-02-F02-AA]PMZ22808.1 bifunctional tRNA (5-methylaminomethyl-2-thiouridine)(34)-methyltransferase MnmD/FAD-dependent 5-carboxymethylaminomethyl-2-thiouridine(34) oxidoreductase MnmC 